MPYSLRLIEHDIAPGATLSLPAAIRVLFPSGGDVVVGLPARDRVVSRETAWHGAAACQVRSPNGIARLLRFELVPQPPPGAAGGYVRLEHPIPIDRDGAYLLRCDRVDFAPGGVALPHRHRGGGIRRLLRGALTVTVGHSPPRLIRPGDAWFESGREPVLAVAAADADTSFVRVSVLPAEIRGTTSITYVDPADAARGRPRAYTVFVDEPIMLRGAPDRP